MIAPKKTKKLYINNKLFEGYNLKDYVIPIYTAPKLEHVLFKSGLIPKKYIMIVKSKRILQNIPYIKRTIWSFKN